MKQDVTEVIFILDRSGSMGGLEDDTIGGFNSTLEKQKELVGDVVVSTVLFDNEFEVLHNRLDINSINPLTKRLLCKRNDSFIRFCGKIN